MKEFITKHQQNILGTLSGLDRVRFRGTFRYLAVPALLYRWLAHQRVLFKDFANFAQSLTERLKGALQQFAVANGKSIQFLESPSISKEELVRELIRREGLTEGVVGVFSATEPCRSYEVRRNAETKMLDIVGALRKCLHWYVYLQHPVLGLSSLRIQSWLPFTVHVCVNGREMLCRELTRRGIDFERRDNCLAHVADFDTAQGILDQQPWFDWSGQLTDLVRRVCPPLLEVPYVNGYLWPYWSADETEYATDVLFRSDAALAQLYPSLLRHSMTTFSSRHVMRFLGKVRIPKTGVDSRFNGEVATHLLHRPEGVCVKHRLNRNSLKMYDKQGSVLRIETTINDTNDFGVHRAAESDGPAARLAAADEKKAAEKAGGSAKPAVKKKWRRLRKGVVDLPRRCEISRRANSRYLTAQAAVDAATPLGELTERLALPVVSHGHRSRGLHPLAGLDAQFMNTVLKGEYTLNGFRNRDLRESLFENSDDPVERCRQAGRVTRLLRLFRDHGLIQKVPRTHRYQLTAEGRRVLPAFSAARAASTQALGQLAA